MIQSSFQSLSQIDQSSIFKILIATDNHLGFKENDLKRGKDSYDAFTEILQKAKQLKVDFILLGGDLFHEISPSPDCLYETIKILQQNVLGPGDIDFQIFDYQPNFSDQNLNIDLPIFIIHGNHDAPTSSLNNISALDLLHAGKYLNYYGKHINNEYVKVYPIRFSKGDTKIALYGIGYMKDSRLYKLFEQRKIEFVRPSDSDKYLNILVVHQNRFKGERFGAQYKNCVHPQQFPNWMNLVIWGHEHESKAQVEEYQQLNFQIYQPGSSVAVKLIEEEAKPKAIGLLRIFQNQYDFEAIYLKDSFRAMLYQQLELTQYLKKKEGTNNINFVFDNEAAFVIEETLENLLKKWEEEEIVDIPKEKRRLPLVRLKIEYSGLDILRTKQIENKYKDRVANEGEILQFWRRRQEQNKNAESTKITDEQFYDTFSNKKSFNLQANDEHKELIRLFAKKMEKHNMGACPIELILECIDFEKPNQNKLQNQLNVHKRSCLKNIMTEENYKLKQQNQQIQSKMDWLKQSIQSNIEENQSVKDIDQDIKDLNFKYVVSDHIDQFQKNLINKINIQIKNQNVDVTNQDIQQQQQQNQIKVENKNEQDSCIKIFQQMQNQNQDQEEEEESKIMQNQNDSKQNSKSKDYFKMEIQNFITTNNQNQPSQNKHNTFFIKKNNPENQQQQQQQIASIDFSNNEMVKKLDFENSQSSSSQRQELDEEFLTYFNAENENINTNKGKKKKVQFESENPQKILTCQQQSIIPSIKDFQVQKSSNKKRQLNQCNDSDSNSSKVQQQIPQMFKQAKDKKRNR